MGELVVQFDCDAPFLVTCLVRPQQRGQLRETIAGLNARIRAHADDAVEEKLRWTTEPLQARRITLFFRYKDAGDAVPRSIPMARRNNWLCRKSAAAQALLPSGIGNTCRINKSRVSRARWIGVPRCGVMATLCSSRLASVIGIEDHFGQGG